MTIRTAFANDCLPIGDAENLERALILAGYPLPDRADLAATSLPGVRRVLANLAALRPTLTTFARSGDLGVSPVELTAIGKTLDRFLAIPARSPALPPAWQEPVPEKPSRNPFHGVKDEVPLPPVLWAFTAHGHPGLALLASAIVTSHQLHSVSWAIDDLRRLYGATIALEVLLKGRHPAMVAALPTSGSSLEGYYQQWLAITDRSDKQRHNQVRWLLRVASGAARKRIYTDVGPRQPRAPRGAPAPDDPMLEGERSDPPASDGDAWPWQVQDVLDPPLSEAESEIVRGGSTVPESVGAGQLVLEELDDGAPRQALSKHHLAIRAAQVAKGLARSNQQLGGSLAKLTDLEARQLVEATIIWDAASGPYWSDGAACTLASLLTGRPAEELAHYQLVTLSEGQAWPVGSGMLIKDASGMAWWALLPGEPKVKAQEELSDLRRPRASCLYLPCPPLFSSRLDWSQPQLARSPPNAGAMVVRFLGRFDLNASRLGRWTSDRVRGWLARAIHLSGTSGVAAAIITGELTSALNAPSHYEAWDGSALLAIYRHALARIGLADDLPPLLSPHIPGVEAGLSYGSVYCPDIDRYKTAIVALAAKVEQLRRGIERRSGLVAFHNAFTVYTLQLLGLAGALRAINEPLPPLAAIEPDLGVVLINDKDVQDGYNTRLVPLAPVAINQLRYWYAHADTVMAHIAATDTPAALDLRARRGVGRMAIQPYFLTAEGQLDQATVSKIDGHARAHGCLFVPNSGRHVAATILKDRIPVDYLRCFIGHWVTGTEPFATTSALDPSRYVPVVRDAMALLMTEMGFVAVKGASDG